MLKRLRPVAEVWCADALEHEMDRPDRLIEWLCVRAGTPLHLVYGDYESVTVEIVDPGAYFNYLRYVNAREDAALFVEESPDPKPETQSVAWTILALKNSIDVWQAFARDHHNEPFYLKIDR